MLHFEHGRQFALWRYSPRHATLTLLALKEWNRESGERVHLHFQGVTEINLPARFVADAVVVATEELPAAPLTLTQDTHQRVLFLLGGDLVGTVDTLQVQHATDHGAMRERSVSPLMNHWFGLDVDGPV